jgi:predicted  nucleic acid-binding Zn-ribbon protein
MMEEKVMLMTQIRELRRQNANLVKKQRVIKESNKSAYTAEELNKILDVQKDQIAQLTKQLKQLQQEGTNIKGAAAPNESVPVDLTANTAWPSSTSTLKTVSLF